MSSVKFPSLEIHPDDVDNSRQEFHDSSHLAVELPVADIGKIGHTDQER